LAIPIVDNAERAVNTSVINVILVASIIMLKFTEYASRNHTVITAQCHTSNLNFELKNEDSDV
jgi:hypothetical protein